MIHQLDIKWNWLKSIKALLSQLITNELIWIKESFSFVGTNWFLPVARIRAATTTTFVFQEYNTQHLFA